MTKQTEANRLMERTWLTGALILAQHGGHEPRSDQIELLRLYREQQYTVIAAVKAVFRPAKKVMT